MSRSRLEAIHGLLASIESEESVTEGASAALAMAVSDATLANDEPSLDALVESLRRRQGRWPASERNESDDSTVLRGVLRVAEAALDRLVPSNFIVQVTPGSHAHSFLRLIEERPGVRNADISEALGVHETEVSRVGRKLSEGGFAKKQRVGTTNFWEISPRGRAALAAVSAFENLTAITEDESAPPLDQTDLESGENLVSKYVDVLTGKNPAEVLSCSAALIRLPAIAREPELLARIASLLDTSARQCLASFSEQPAESRRQAIVQAFPTASEAY